MPAQPLPTVTAFDWVPDFARGLVRDIKVRWAMEELGLRYGVEILPAFGERSADYLARQPFDQVPAFSDGPLDLFESGAILLYLAQKHPGLLPADEGAAWKARCWLFAAYASVEPFITRLIIYDLFHADKAWAKEAREPAVALVRQKLKRVADALGDAEWLAGIFSVADIAMVTTLENLRGTALVAEQPGLVRYMQRAKDRPAFQRALDAQLADFTGSPPEGWDN
ncbi:glutathione S-transferase family protein [Altererythrobacter sp. KTW20L]|uniref:glutathione S-transferase family protein n=1 Tax=Altererythrobacter sp. KTW20L TaxID=2942210 RepID=UPI0020BF3572|nr:glutathione S-transferase family protein [Altererythrobacter sp. KTW20L]